MRILNLLQTKYTTLITKLYFRIKGVKYGKGFISKGIPFLSKTSGGNITIGNNVRINNTIKSNPIGGNQRCIFSVGANGSIIIGDNCGISGCAIVSKKLITIEENVLIGGNTVIYDNDFHPINISERHKTNQELVSVSPIKLGANSFIGAHSIILKGVTVGLNSIVGAGSVITKNVPDNQIWAGNPAKYIKDIK